MYQLLRSLHLVAGLFSAAFLVAYGLSAAQMALPIPIYGPRSVETKTTVEVPPGVDTTPRALAQWLMQEHGTRGQLTGVGTENNSVILNIGRLGARHRIVFDSATRTANVATVTQNAAGMLNRIHQSYGIDHDYWAVNAWGWFLVVVSMLLLVLAVTGIVMWFMRHSQRRSGAFVLMAGLALGLTSLILVRLA